jgi:hypothetical protein
VRHWNITYPNATLPSGVTRVSPPPPKTRISESEM